MNSLPSILENHSLPVIDLYNEIDRYLNEHLSDSRYLHVLHTVKKAIKLAEQYNISEKSEMQKLVLAALCHDITKEMPVEFHLELFKKNHVEKYSEYPGTLLHAKSAPFFIAEKFNITAPEIHHAIFYHSTGCAEMPLFSRIIFCADFLASEYKKKSEVVFDKNLNSLCLEKISASLAYLISKKMPVQDESINFYNILVYELKH